MCEGVVDHQESHGCSTSRIVALLPKRDDLEFVSYSSTTAFPTQRIKKLTFSAILAASLAFGKVVLMVSWCSKADTRFLNPSVLDFLFSPFRLCEGSPQ